VISQHYFLGIERLDIANGSNQFHKVITLDCTRKRTSLNHNGSFATFQRWESVPLGHVTQKQWELTPRVIVRLASDQVKRQGQALEEFGLFSVGTSMSGLREALRDSARWTAMLILKVVGCLPGFLKGSRNTGERLLELFSIRYFSQRRVNPDVKFFKITLQVGGRDG
jgi:hypothetical protein